MCLIIIKEFTNFIKGYQAFPKVTKYDEHKQNKLSVQKYIKDKIEKQHRGYV